MNSPMYASISKNQRHISQQLCIKNYNLIIARTIAILAVSNYNIVTIIRRKEVYMSTKKRGRPFSENPKTLRVDVRLTKDELKILDEYCERKCVSRPQGLRDGIKALQK